MTPKAASLRLSPCFFGLMLAFALSRVICEESPRSANGDPGLSLDVPKLTAAEEATVRGWFKELGNDDFDARESAMSKIIGSGPAVLPIAQEFTNDPDREIATNAKGLRLKMLLKYDGFWPTDLVIKKALSKPLTAPFEWITDAKKSLLLADTILDLAAKTGVKAELDASCVDPHIAMPMNDAQVANDYLKNAKTPADYIDGIARLSMWTVVRRGNSLLITSQENGKRLAIQRRTLDWSRLELDRDEAARLEKALIPFFSTETELHSGSSTLAIAGTEESILRAARLIALLQRNTPDAVWPRIDFSDPNALLKKLSEPIAIRISSDSLPEIVQALKTEHLDVDLQGPDDSVVKMGINASPDSARVSMATLKLNFKPGVPAGLVLRWCEWRSKLLELDRESYVLKYSISPDGKIIFRTMPAGRVIDDPVCGADVSFLYPAPREFNEKNDAAVEKQLLQAFESHLELFPALNFETHFRVLRGRLIVKGCEATLSRVLKLVGDWRASGKPPPPLTWRSALDEELDAKVDWNGQGMTAGTILGALRNLGRINILLEDSPTKAVDFELTPKDAELLPPGRYAFRELLDDLAKRAKAEWRIQLGVVVLMPN